MSSASPLEPRIAVVTGASSGIGAATARKLAAQGMRVVLVARREERLSELAGQIREQGGEALACPADLSEEFQRAALFARVMETYGRVDVLVNDAGFGWYGYSAQMPWELARQMIALNISAGVQLTLSCLPVMLEQGGGSIVNVGSMVGDLPSQGVAAYAASKSYLNAYSTALYRELRGTPVHVSLVKPGPVKTEFFDSAAGLSSGRRIPAERFAVSPEKVADCIWSVIRRPRRVAYVPGVVAITPWVELGFAWLIDRLGPLLLRVPG